MAHPTTKRVETSSASHSQHWLRLLPTNDHNSSHSRVNCRFFELGLALLAAPPHIWHSHRIATSACSRRTPARWPPAITAPAATCRLAALSRLKLASTRDFRQIAADTLYRRTWLSHYGHAHCAPPGLIHNSDIQVGFVLFSFLYYIITTHSSLPAYFISSRFDGVYFADLKTKHSDVP